MAIIKNLEELANTPLRKKALEIIEAGISSVLPAKVLPSAVHYNPRNQTLYVNKQACCLPGRVFVVGGGKASGALASAIEDVIPGEKLVTGVVTCKGGSYDTDKIKVVQAGHPLPDIRGMNAVQEILGLKNEYDIGADDTVLCLLSGGGSALLPKPADGVTLEDKLVVTERLLESGADIHEINTIRKHLSGVKGGRLGLHFAPATVISLVISDVVDNDLSVIASGPTYPDSTTYHNALDVLKKYHLLTTVPPVVLHHLRKGDGGEIPETPKILHNCRNYILADNRTALDAMYQKAKELGCKPYIITAVQTGETNAVALLRAKEVLTGVYRGYDAVILGGETTPVLPPTHGKGGRNQQYTAVSMIALRELAGEWVLASVGTDGSDYIAEVAGAIADNDTLHTMQSLGLDAGRFTARFDSHTLFSKLGGSLIVTGDTGTNVGDIVLYLMGK